MSIELKMPALSPTMEEGTLAKWLVKEGDEVKSGDLLAEIETDKATMEFEAVDEGKIAKILVPEGSEGVKVGAPIAILATDGEDVSAIPSPQRGEGQGEGAPKPDEPTSGPTPSSQPSPPRGEEAKPPPAPAPVETPAAPAAPAAPPHAEGDRVKASPLAKRLAQAQNIDLSSIQGSGP
ncbi:MAG TPA: biotin/lipoyl-containing protein, partial [Sphingomicrobium sp.]|nr:biotin/lipoyl-containing protein [Sphingomicrobium sp.]